MSSDPHLFNDVYLMHSARLNYASVFLCIVLNVSRLLRRHGEAEEELCRAAHLLRSLLGTCICLVVAKSRIHSALALSLIIASVFYSPHIATVDSSPSTAPFSAPVWEALGVGITCG